MTIDQWLATVAGWKPKMSVSVNVAELGQLISDHIAVCAKLEAVENWACENVAGDELRAILWPAKSEGRVNEERRAPVQKAEWASRTHPSKLDRTKPGAVAGTVTWTEHLEAYQAYADRYGRQQSAERIAERHGFSYCELTQLLGHEPTTWKAR
jgi:hypothetical protein